MSGAAQIEKMPLRVGLTGGIASGKSTVADMFEALGAVIIDTDVIAREVVRPGQPALAEIREAFGDGVIAADGTLDRPAMRAIVFGDDGARRRLEAILHPRIGEATREQADAAGGVHVRREGRELVGFASNDYLGLSQDRRLIRAAINGVQRYGTGLETTRRALRRGEDRAGAERGEAREGREPEEADSAPEQVFIRMKPLSNR